MSHPHFAKALARTGLNMDCNPTCDMTPSAIVTCGMTSSAIVTSPPCVHVRAMDMCRLASVSAYGAEGEV
jgi:hypothetical protein